MTNKITLNSISSSVSKYLNKDDTKGNLNKIKASFFAVLLGIILASLLILFQGGNPFSVFYSMFTIPFGSNKFDDLIYNSAIFILLGVGIGVSFKTGLFNIGAPSQFLMGGVFTMMIGSKLDMPKFVGLPFLMIISIIAGAFFAGISGILKAKFNVHEVVSTLLMNWVLFYFAAWINQRPIFKNATMGDGNSVSYLDNMRFSRMDSSNDYWLAFFIALSLAVLVFVIFKYTTLGYKLKVNGSNTNAASYAGINKNVNTMVAMMISGAFAGLAGYIAFSWKGNVMALASKPALPTEGFDAITVTLLSFSSAIGSIPAGIFYALIVVGKPASHVFAGGNVSSNTIDLCVGLIIFASALTNSFINFQPIRKTQTLIAFIKSKNLMDKRKLFYENKKSYWGEIKIKLNKEKCIWIGDKKELRLLRQKMKHEITKLDRTNKEKFNFEKTVIIDKYNSLIETDILKYKGKKELIKRIQTTQLNQIDEIRNMYINKKFDIITRDSKIKDVIEKNNILITEQKLNSYSDSKKAAKVYWIESVKTYKFEVNVLLDDYRTKLKNLRIQKWQTINNNEKNKIKEQIANVKKDWKEVQNA